MVLAEIETPSAALATISPPTRVGHEVTADPSFTGGHLVTLDAPALVVRLASSWPAAGAPEPSEDRTASFR